MFTSTAKVEYHSHWVIAKCDQDLVQYYRWWVWRKTGLWLMTPMFGAHISIVRGDIEEGTWESNMDGETITFNYENNLLCFPPYIWLPVWGEDLFKIREKIGMPKEPKKPFHMSVGRVEDHITETLDILF